MTWILRSIYSLATIASCNYLWESGVLEMELIIRGCLACVYGFNTGMELHELQTCSKENKYIKTSRKLQQSCVDVLFVLLMVTGRICYVTMMPDMGYKPWCRRECDVCRGLRVFRKHLVVSGQWRQCECFYGLGTETQPRILSDI